MIKIHTNSKVSALLEALKEASCWITDGSRRTPEQRGAKCQTADDVRRMIAAAVEKANKSLLEYDYEDDTRTRK